MPVTLQRERLSGGVVNVGLHALLDVTVARLGPLLVLLFDRVLHTHLQLLGHSLVARGQRGTLRIS
jgi:hypothetical protein